MKIRNKQTGEIKEIDPSQASQYGISAPSQPAQAPDILRSLGLGGVEDAFNNFKQNPVGLNIPSQEEVSHAPQNAAGALSYMLPSGLPGGGITSLAGIAKALLGYGATGAARGELYGMSQGKNPVEALPYAAGGAALEPVAGVAGAALKYPTKGALYNKGMVPAAQRATDAGVTRNFEDISQAARDAMVQKYGDSAEVKQAVDKVLSKFTPASITHEAPLTPNDILQTRNQMSALYGKNALQRAFQNALGNSDLEDKAAAVVKRVFSENLKSASPEMANFDKAYSLYSNPLIGSPARLALEIPGILALKSLLGNMAGGHIGDVLGGLLGQ